MPEGSTVKIKDLKLQHDDPNEEPIKNVELPEEIESLWEKTIKEIAEERESEGIPEEEIEPNKSIYERFVNRVTRKGFEIEEYSFIKHGPIVDFKLPEGFNYKEIDLYEINAPYAYVRIVHEPELHEYQYHVIEPVLTEKEKELLETVKTRLIESLDVNLKSIADESARQYLKKRINKLLKDYRINLSTKNREKIVYYITRDFVGYGEIDAMMRDTNIEDISCDGPLTPIYIYHKKYNSIPSNVNFEDDDELDTFAIRVAQVCGRHLSLANPLLDATMPDGSRIQLTLGREVTTRGSTFTIRRFNENPLTPADLIDFHTYSTAMMAYLWLAVESSKSIIFAGGTASGKTTAMNAISLFIQPEMKIVSIEDTRELNLPHPNWIPGVTREAFAGEDKGSIEMYELLRASLRQRPEYILVGEVRGAEAYVLFQAMSTGHTTFSTMHADSVQAIVHRLENPPINVPRIMIQALDVVAIQAQVKVGDERVRRCKSLTEIVGVDTRTGELLTNEVFIWNAANDLFQYSGRSYIIESVMENRGWDEVKVREELKRRQEVLDWARTKSIRHYEDISKIIVAYNREPEMIIKIVRQDLYG
ncbi:MAG: type II/IV secretion system ATPase subunit [Methanosarcinaceae archaeon]|nr:type II/IV secretion system ATPase subunit [Methanosarcinaceae archaeon]